VISRVVSPSSLWTYDTHDKVTTVIVMETDPILKGTHCHCPEKTNTCLLPPSPEIEADQGANAERREEALI
jgi:hypothetical protein